MGVRPRSARQIVTGLDATRVPMCGSRRGQLGWHSRSTGANCEAAPGQDSCDLQPGCMGWAQIGEQRASRSRVVCLWPSTDNLRRWAVGGPERLRQSVEGFFPVAEQDCRAPGNRRRRAAARRAGT